MQSGWGSGGNGNPPGGGGWGGAPPGGAPPGGGGYGSPPAGAPPGGGGGYGAPPPGGGGGYGAPPGAGYNPPGGSDPGGFGQPPPGGGWGGGGGPGGGGFGGGGFDGGGGENRVGEVIPFSATDPISYAWNMGTQNIGALVPILLILLAVMAVSFVINFPLGILQNVLMQIIIKEVKEPILAMGIGFVFIPFRMIINSLGTAAITAGIFNYSLKLLRGQKAELGDVFNIFQFLLPLILGSILFTIVMNLGFLLCIVPAVILSLGLQFYGALIVDKKLGPIEALKKSWELTDGHKVTLLVYGILAFLIMFAAIALCCLPALFIFPVLSVAQTFIYLRLSGETPSTTWVT
jgi:uncharacterized membrane protein